MGDLQHIGTATSDQISAELPDIRLPEKSRRKLKMLVRVMAEVHSVDELMYLAGALEHEANTKRGGEAS